jgi:hypothetical protein
MKFRAYIYTGSTLCMKSRKDAVEWRYVRTKFRPSIVNMVLAQLLPIDSSQMLYLVASYDFYSLSQ